MCQVQSIQFKGIFNVCLAFILLNISACGSSSTAITTSSSSSSVALTGTVVTQASASASLSANLTNAAISHLEDGEVAAADVECTLYTMEGETIGTSTTDADGAYTVAADLTTLKDADDTDTTWTTTVVNDCPSEGLTNIVDITVIEGTTTTASLGETDLDTSLAAQLITQDLTGFAGWGTDYSDVAANIDIGCQMVINKGLFENSDGAQEGSTGQSIEQARKIMKGLMATKADPAEYGYDNYSAMMADIIDGDMANNSNFNTILSQAATGNSDVVPDTYANMYTNGAATAFTAMDTIMDNATTATTTAALRKAKSLRFLAGDTDDNFCDKIKNTAGELTEEERAAMIKGFATTTMAGTPTEALASFGPDVIGGMDTLLGFYDNCATDGNCSELATKGPATFKYFNGLGGDFSSIYDRTAGAFNAQAFDVIHGSMANCTGTTVAELEKCGGGMAGTIAAAGGFDAFYTEEGVVNTNELKTWSEYWEVQDGYDPEAVDVSFYAEAFSSLGTTFQNVATNGDSDPLKICIDEANAAGRDSADCFTSAGVGNVTEFNTYVDPVTGNTGPVNDGDNINVTYCGDGTCNGAETAIICAYDCSSDFGQGFQYEEAVCGDNQCMAASGETPATCPLDCQTP